MKDLKILIVEDEQLIAESLSEILCHLEHNVIGIASGIIKSRALLSKNPDLVLLDIHLNGQDSGFDFAEQLNDEGIPFIFITAFADEATLKKAVEKNPVGYLVKPFGFEDVNTTIDVAMNNHINLNLNKAVIISNDDKRIYLRVDSRLVNVKENEIFWIEAKGDYMILKTETNTYIIHSTLKNLEEKLSPSRFLKVHRSFIVNLDKVIDIEDTNLTINEKVIPISRSNKEQLMRKINIV